MTTMLAVVTPYFREPPEILARARRSVEAQTIACRHILVADGHPQPELCGWPVEHIVLPAAHGDGGNFARGVGALHAIQTGANAVAFLDADNWLEPEHLASLVAAAASTGAPVCTSARTLRRPDGSFLDALDPESDGHHFADTSTLLIDRRAADILALWATLPPALGACGDQAIWAAIHARGYATAHTGLPTLHYTTRWIVHYAQRNEPPPDDGKDNSSVAAAARYWQEMPDGERRRLLGGERP